MPLSFFRESKVVLASTIIFFEDTSCSYYEDPHDLNSHARTIDQVE